MELNVCKRKTNVVNGVQNGLEHMSGDRKTLSERIVSKHVCYQSVKQIAGPGWMHETSAWGWCTGMTQRDGMGREVGWRFRMGNTCKSMADSCQCMAKTTTIL